MEGIRGLGLWAQTGRIRHLSYMYPVCQPWIQVHIRIWFGKKNSYVITNIKYRYILYIRKTEENGYMYKLTKEIPLLLGLGKKKEHRSNTQLKTPEFYVGNPNREKITELHANLIYYREITGEEKRTSHPLCIYNGIHTHFLS